VLEDRTVPSGFQQINLTSLQPGLGHFTDTNLNGWGMASLPDGDFVVANAFTTGLATFYDRSGHVLPETIAVPVEAPESGVLAAVTGQPISTQYGHPTGVVYNPTKDFVIANPATGASAPATLIFDTLDGIICGWNPVVDPTHAIVLHDALADTGAPAVYTSLDIGQSQGHNVLYATDFFNDQLDIIGPDQAPDGRLTNINPISCAGRGVPSDPNSSVWSASAVNDILIVTFADLLGPVRGGGAVDVFNTDGVFQYQIDQNGPTSNVAANATGRLENPWGVTQAPANFGAYSNDLLVGNVWGHGNINAYKPDANGNYTNYAGRLAQPNGAPIAIKGLWDLEFGDGTPISGKTNQLFFDAGPNKPGDATGGLFGVILAAGDQGGNGGGAGSTKSLQVAHRGAHVPPASPKTRSHSHGGGSGGPGGSFYPTASTVSQLVADINYANSVGGTITINLQPGTTFDLNQINNTSSSYYDANALPIVGGTKAVDLTILGNGDTIEWAGGSTYPNVEVRLLDVAPAGSLTLDDVKLRNGSAVAGGAIYNRGTLNIIDQSTLSGNSASDGGAIYNLGGTVAISDSILSDNSAFLGGAIYNDGGTVTVGDNSTLSGNDAVLLPVGYGGGPSGMGGGVYNSAGTLTVSDCTILGNTASLGGGIYNAGTAAALTVSVSTFSGNNPDNIFGPYVDGGGNTFG
jgi:uncharacterized protein (TIGR03118 family)